MKLKSLFAGTLCVLATCPSYAQNLDREIEGPLHTVSGREFQTYTEYVDSGLVGIDPLRCISHKAVAGSFSGGADCTLGFTNPSSAYDPVEIIEINVVFHVLRSTSGTQGNITLAQLETQIDILNEDFQGLAGTPGANGFNSAIRFKLADTDPQGNAATGVTYHDNTSWFNDSGNYWSSTSWDATRYLNIYTNNASGSLGYITRFPQESGAGTAVDRVVALWSTVGRNAPYGFPYNQGRTVTHEVGHYLGLFHTFQSGCGSAVACYTTGDVICDTNPESGPEFGCAVGSQSCGSTDPIRNYMNYSYDTCMQNFTQEQSARMRCAIEHYRPLVGTVIPGGLGLPYCEVVSNSTGLDAVLDASGSSEVSMNDLQMEASDMPMNQFGYLLTSQTQGFVASPGTSSGNLCLGGTIGRYVGQVQNTGGTGTFDVPVDLTMIPLSPPVAVQVGETWNFQVWFRDQLITGPTSNFTNGYEIMFE